MLNDIENIIKEVFSSVLDINKENIDENITRSTAENWDSFQHLLLISELEKELNIKFDMQELEKINGYNDIKEIIIKKSTLK